MTSIKWVPHAPGKFLAAHTSGHIYLYDVTLPSDQQKPVFIQTKSPIVKMCPSNGNVATAALSLYINKTRGENPANRLSLRTGCVNQIAFSECGSYFALACQDGFLRVFCWGTQSQPNLELCVAVRSFFGGFLCVAWSPDGRYLATGGEDDLITLVSFNENRVVCRGTGHKSWIADVAFDQFASVCGIVPESSSLNHTSQTKLNEQKNGIIYRLASVGQDTILCVWEITEDILVQSQQQLLQKQRLRSRSSLLVNGTNQLNVFSPNGARVFPVKQAFEKQQPLSQNMLTSTDSSNILSAATSPTECLEVDVNSTDFARVQQLSPATYDRLTPSPASTVGSASGSVSSGFASKLAFWHRDKQKGSKSSKSKKGKDKKIPPNQRPMSENSGSTGEIATTQVEGNQDNGLHEHSSKLLTPTLLGSPSCPRLGDVPNIDPIVQKKIAWDPLTGVAFLRDCLLTACQGGWLAVWSRPNIQPADNTDNSATIPSSSTTKIAF